MGKGMTGGMAPDKGELRDPYRPRSESLKIWRL